MTENLVPTALPWQRAAASRALEMPGIGTPRVIYTGYEVGDDWHALIMSDAGVSVADVITALQGALTKLITGQRKVEIISDRTAD